MLFENLGPYKIERLIGRGGMGAVYEGVHRKTGARHAVKTLALGLTDDEGFRQRFEVEILSMKDLAHTNIVRLISQPGADGVPLYLMEQQGLLFYAMELVDGRNLHELLTERGRLPWREVVDIALQACGALKHAHAHGTIHRDIKPANLVIDRNGHVKLTDFGIARFFEVSHLTMPGGVIGTADFMSPEQADGKTVDATTDMYSLGAVMYALMSGNPPFTGRTAADVIIRLKSEVAKPICDVVPDVPAELGMIVDQLLAKASADRVPTLRLLENRLNATLHGLARSDELMQEPPQDKGESSSSAPNSLDRPRIDDDDDTFVGSHDAEPGKTAPVDEQPTSAANTPDSQTPEEGKDEAPTESGPARDTGLHEGTDGGTASSGTGGGDTGGGDTGGSGPIDSGYDDDGATGRPTISEDGSYTMVDLRQGRSTGIRIDEEAFKRKSPVLSVVSTVVLLAGLLGVAYGVFYLAQPPPPETLFAEIANVTRDRSPQKYNDVRREMEQFVAHYEAHEKGPLVRAMLDDHDGFRRWKSLKRSARLNGGNESLSEPKRSYLEAMRQRSSDPGEAIKRLTAFVEKWHDSDDEGTPQLVAWAQATTVVLKWQIANGK
jgi:serine/threonine-protein kinase